MSSTADEAQTIPIFPRTSFQSCDVKQIKKLLIFGLQVPGQSDVLIRSDDWRHSRTLGFADPA